MTGKRLSCEFCGRTSHKGLSVKKRVIGYIKSETRKRDLDIHICCKSCANSKNRNRKISIPRKGLMFNTIYLD